MFIFCFIERGFVGFDRILVEIEVSCFFGDCIRVERMCRIGVWGK